MTTQEKQMPTSIIHCITQGAQLLSTTTVMLVVLLLFSTQLSAQANRKQDIREQIMSERIAFFTQSLSLTKKEAREFWPVYDAFETKKNETLISLRKLLTEYKKSDNLSAGEYIRLSDRFVELKAIEAGLYRDLNQALKGILPPEKIIQLYYTEEQYKRHLIQQLRNY